MSWRWWLDEPRSGAANMALDHALARTTRPGEAWLRLYRWARPTLSFGRNEPARDLYDLQRLQRDGTDVVRRPTGGRVVLHDDEITYAVVLAAPERGSLRPIFRRIHDGIRAGLDRLGVMADGIPEAEDAATLDAGPCFGRPAAGELAVGGRKLVGSAQARLEGRILQHGSVLRSGRQERIGRWRVESAADRMPEGATLEEVMGRLPAWSEVAEALARGMQDVWGGTWARGRPPAPVYEHARALAARYGGPDWTWRR